ARLRHRDHEGGRIHQRRQAVGSLSRAPTQYARRRASQGAAHRDSPRDCLAELMPRARRHLASSFAASAVIAMLATACASARGPAVPTIVDVEPALAATAEAEETALLARVDAYDDPDLTDYLASV